LEINKTVIVASSWSSIFTLASSTAFGAYSMQTQTKTSEMLLLFQAILNTEKVA
jgi:hypothetical protein